MTQTSESLAGGRADGGDPAAEEERPIATIVNDLWLNAETLIRQELQLGLAEAQERVDALKSELTGQLARLRVEVTGQLLAALVLFAGLLSIVAALVLLLAHAVSPWLAALLVGVIISSAGVALLYRSAPQPSSTTARGLTPQHRVHENIKPSTRP
jgi:hypothetical protein